MDPEAGTGYVDINKESTERLFCASVTLALSYVHFFECVAGFVVSSFLFPTCLVFFTAKPLAPLALELTKSLG